MLHGQAKIENLMPRLRSMSCHLILFAAVNAVPPLSPFSCVEILSPLFQPSPLAPLSPLSHFLLEGKNTKDFWKPVFVSRK